MENLGGKADITLPQTRICVFPTVIHLSGSGEDLVQAGGAFTIY